MPVFAASVRALVTPVEMSTSMAGRRAAMVCHSTEGVLHVGGQPEAAQDHLVMAGLLDGGVEEAPQLFSTPHAAESSQ